MKPEISIIIPVYNAEVTLSRCVDSILAQTLSAWELLLVNDGSTDRSGALCDEYAQKDARIAVLHQENAGVSAARNAGLDAAAGEFVGFVDADDCVFPEMFGRLLSDAKETRADVVMCDPVILSPDGGQTVDSIPQLAQSTVLTKSDFSPELLSVFAGAVWRCVFRKSLIDTHELRFPMGLKLSEDRVFNLCALGASERVYYRREPLYNYYILDTGACQKFHPDFIRIVRDADRHAEESLLKYWGKSYLPAYKRLIAIQGALDAVYRICGPANPEKSFWRRVSAVRSVTREEFVANAFCFCRPEGIRERLLRCRAAFCLTLAGHLVNAKRRKG